VAFKDEDVHLSQALKGAWYSGLLNKATNKKTQTNYKKTLPSLFEKCKKNVYN
jgi:hypothetical protein